MGFVVPAGAELIAELSGGATFRVARIRLSGRACICKRLNRQIEDQPRARHALTREARVLSAAQHPGLPRVINVGSDSGGPFLIETEIQGRSVREIVDHWTARATVPPQTLALHVAAQTTTMLADLWEAHGFVHGDLAPEHVLVGPFGELGLVDFGASSATSVKGDGDVGRGTVPFVSPEVARGQQSPDAENDIFAMGVIALLLIRGSSPTEHLSEAARLVAAAEQGVAVESFRDLDPSMSAVLRRALAPQRRDRYRTMRDLARAFVELVPGSNSRNR